MGTELGYLNQLAYGAGITVGLGMLAFALAVICGGAMGWAIASRSWFVVIPWRIYSSIVMGVPSALIIFVVYYGGGYLFADSFEFSPFYAGLVALVVIYTAYIAELVRGAVRNIPRGQFEASAALGIPSRETWRYVIAPQVLRLLLPGLVTTWMVVLRDTAVVSLIGLNELVASAKTAAGASKAPFLYFITAALLFVVMTDVTQRVSAWLERRFDRGIAKTRA